MYARGFAPRTTSKLYSCVWKLSWREIFRFWNEGVQEFYFHQSYNICFQIASMERFGLSNRFMESASESFRGY